MADIRNNGGVHSDSNLKSYDSEKSNSVFSTSMGTDNKFSISTSADAFKSVKKKKKSKVPVIVDILIALLLLAIVSGAVVGAIYLYRWVVVDYESVNIKYEFIVSKDMLDENSTYSNLKNKFLYCDIDGNSYSFGKIDSAEFASNGGLKLTVSVNAKYREQEGYLIDDFVVAVGKSYLLHTENARFDGTIVELHGKK